jgi:hypothetical protein
VISEMEGPSQLECDTALHLGISKLESKSRCFGCTRSAKCQEFIVAMCEPAEEMIKAAGTGDSSISSDTIRTSTPYWGLAEQRYNERLCFHIIFVDVPAAARFLLTPHCNLGPGCVAAGTFKYVDYRGLEARLMGAPYFDGWPPPSE